ncbi:ATP-binding protein [Fimbriiglobus ruber]|uniref:histidine kinase n=1 Tax=Fimbriiglobus ruber TaxID=1908690 RepID=A0A225DJI1_9BACT|nr:ATP-binding protein [Fimbriiglobus ruber]OWK37339.1 sensory box histidine kinase/response regulator [Fimbriiglobus ruber]
MNESSPPLPEGTPGDIPTRLQADQLLRDERFRLLVQAVTDYAIFMLDPDGLVVCWNTGAERVFGYQEAEIVGQHYARFFTPEDTRAGEPDRELRTAFEHGRFEGESVRVRKGGERFLVTVLISPIRRNETGTFLGYSQITRDVTDRKRIEEQLRHAQKIEAVGTLAAGVAHDFNNLLTIINGYSQILFASLHEHDTARKPVDEIIKAGERAAALTQQLMAFGRKQVLAPQVIDLNALLAGIETLVSKLVGEHVAVVMTLVGDLRRVEADPGQIEQVVVNLVTNARDAMPRGGRLSVTTRNVELGGTRVATGIKPGPYVALGVADEGEGMDVATKARVFEPFFTTKAHGKGTGLGLSSVYGIVTQSGGHVEVESEPGRGATFTVFLPAVDGPVRPEPAFPFSPSIGGGTETLLLVEDEAGILGFGRYLLEKGGYKVLVAANGAEALEVAAHYDGVIHLLVTDVMMPEISGLQVATRLSALRPEMKVLYVSGYSEEAVARQGLFGSGVPFLQKPFAPTSLAAKIREVLDG